MSQGNSRSSRKQTLDLVMQGSLFPDEPANTFRKPAPRMVRLIRAYLDGYRAADWPVQ